MNNRPQEKTRTCLVSIPMRAFQCSRKFSICFSTIFHCRFFRRRFSCSCKTRPAHVYITRDKL